MLFLDTSAILSYKRGSDETVSYLDANEPWFTSTICIYEFVEGAMWQDDVTAHVARQSIGGVRPIELSETVALEAARMQNELRSEGEEMPVRDLLIAATAQSTGSELVVADSDFETGHLTDLTTVTNLSEWLRWKNPRRNVAKARRRARRPSPALARCTPRGAAGGSRTRPAGPP